MCCLPQAAIKGIVKGKINELDVHIFIFLIIKCFDVGLVGSALSLNCTFLILDKPVLTSVTKALKPHINLSVKFI